MHVDNAGGTYVRSVMPVCVQYQGVKIFVVLSMHVQSVGQCIQMRMYGKVSVVFHVNMSLCVQFN